MYKMLYGALLVLVAAPAAQAQIWSDCPYEEERSATVDAGNANLLDLDAGAGSLKIVGKPGLTAVHIRGRACASEKYLLKEIELDAQRVGTTVRVKANTQEHSNFSFKLRQYQRLDIVVEVPAGMAARIDDGSGDMELSGLGATDIDDGSGGIFASDLGDVSINDGSGEIRLTGIHGKVDIDDGSGGIELRDIAGLITIDDGSGEIDVRDTKADVRISDASGSITVANVGGDFIVTDDGSGGIDYDNVHGKVDLPRRTGHGRR